MTETNALISQYPPCFYCPLPSEYIEPKLDDGEVINVCKKHFHYRHMG